MRKHGLFDGINNHIYKEKYVLGICLGMQLMHERSNEFGEIYKGFNHFSGSVNKMTSEILPRIGWGKITSIKKQQQHSVFSSILENDRYYFSHSMHCNSEERYTTSYSEYFNTRIVATIVNKNLFGTQFHPELSGKKGLEILKNFIDL
jgi:glutamine amidotransferase